VWQKLDLRPSRIFGRSWRHVIHYDREIKAKMIEAVVSDYLRGPVEGLTILDVGCGNGGISAYFARKNRQFGVDVMDEVWQQNRSVFQFEQVDSERLPFEDGFFDLVLSHHVIEHVADQGRHLDEIRRVLKAGGLCYLATPNKTSPFMEGHAGNDQVLHYKAMQPLFERHGFSVQEYSYEVASRPVKYFSERTYGAWIPPAIAERLRPWYPNHVFMLKRRPAPIGTNGAP
jgi:ubiquinone/menaquinone biosynthesis C-methylase UbiE